jgi:small subunit ribosomal protein S14
MSTNAKEARFRRDMKRLEVHKTEMQKPAEQRDPLKILAPYQKIRIRMRCRLCGRGRAVYRKFGICRICLRDMASDGLIPGVRKASW